MKRFPWIIACLLCSFTVIFTSACGKITSSGPQSPAEAVPPQSEQTVTVDSTVDTPSATPAAAASAANDLIPMTIAQVAEAVKSSKGSPVLFHLYASWCGPCVHEFPTLLEVAGKFQPKGLKVVIVSLDESRTDLETMFAQYRLSFRPIIIKQSPEDDFAKTMQSMGTTYEDGIPYTAIFDKTGKLKAQWTGSADLDAFEKAITPLL